LVRSVKSTPLPLEGDRQQALAVASPFGLDRDAQAIFPRELFGRLSPLSELPDVSGELGAHV